MRPEYNEQTLSAFAGSWVRGKILLALTEDPAGSAELSTATGAKGKSASHALNILVSEGLAVRELGTYRLTNAGRIQADMLANTLYTLEELRVHKSFWNDHDLSPIPAQLQVKLGDLVGGKVYCGSADDPLESQQAFMCAVRGAKRAWGVSPILAPGYVEMILNLLDNGSDVRLVLSTRVLTKIGPKDVRKAKEYDNFQIYQVTEAPKIGFTVTDKLVSIALFGPNGRYDPTQDLITEGERAVQWGEGLFKYYLEKSSSY